MDEIQIQHFQDENKFSCTYAGKEAVLKYALNSSSKVPEIDFYSTYVPPEFRGKGIAEKLVRAGLAWAKQEGFNIKASCWYAAKFL